MAKVIPAELVFTQHDEWVRREGNVAVVGISDFAQDALGEIVHVELPSVGDEIAAGEQVCEVESVKAVAEIFAPVSGTIVEVNGDLDDEPELLNSDAYGAWIYKIEMSDESEIGALLDAAAYERKLADADQ